MAADIIPARLMQHALSHPNHPAYAEKRGGVWKKTSYAKFANQTRKVAKALMALGLSAGDRVCILGNNRPEWVICHVGTMAAGGAPIGLYTTASASEISYILNHSESAILLIEDEEHWEKVNQCRDDLTFLQTVILMRDAAPIDDPMVLTWESFVDRSEEVEESTFDERLGAITSDQMAQIIYTSGTTGPPKAAMLSHGNLSFIADVGGSLLDMNPYDLTLSYLPLAHVAEQLFTIFLPISHAATVFYAQSLEMMPDNLREVQPTILVGVPRVWEKFHAKAKARLSELKGVRKRLVAWAMGVGSRVTALRNRGEEPTGALYLQYLLADRLVFGTLKPNFGMARVRFCITGAAPIDAQIQEFFAGLDISLHEVYGQTEACGPSTVNAPGRVRYGTVGEPLPHTEIKIAPDGEVLVRGPHVFLGYFKDPEATAENLKDGWLYSGDLGSLNDEGFLTITGRKKEIIVTAGGKNIAPRNVEAAIARHELIEQVVVIGDRRKFISALIALEPEAAARWAADHEADADDLYNNTDLIQELTDWIDQVNPDFARVSQVKKFRVLPRSLSVENGELTPTMKTKRGVVLENWANLIEEMYVDASDPLEDGNRSDESNV